MRYPRITRIFAKELALSGYEPTLDYFNQSLSILREIGDRAIEDVGQYYFRVER